MWILISLSYLIWLKSSANFYALQQRPVCWAAKAKERCVLVCEALVPWIYEVLKELEQAGELLFWKGRGISRTAAHSALHHKNRFPPQQRSWKQMIWVEAFFGQCFIGNCCLLVFGHPLSLMSCGCNDGACEAFLILKGRHCPVGSYPEHSFCNNLLCCVVPQCVSFESFLGCVWNTFVTWVCF